MAKSSEGKSQVNLSNFKYGWDARRSELTSQPGTLMRLENGHINQGAEIEKRKAFVRTELPANTFGLEAGPSGLTVFGSIAAPTMPAGVSYQRLTVNAAIPGTWTMTAFVCSRLFQQKFFVVATFSNGTITKNFCFYDGVNILDQWAGVLLENYTVSQIAALLNAYVGEDSNYTAELIGAGIVAISGIDGNNFVQDNTITSDNGTILSGEVQSGTAAVTGTEASASFTCYGFNGGATTVTVAGCFLDNSASGLDILNWAIPVVSVVRVNNVVTVTTKTPHGIAKLYMDGSSNTSKVYWDTIVIKASEFSNISVNHAFNYTTFTFSFNSIGADYSYTNLTDCYLYTTQFWATDLNSALGALTNAIILRSPYSNYTATRNGTQIIVSSTVVGAATRQIILQSNLLTTSCAFRLYGTLFTVSAVTLDGANITSATHTFPSSGITTLDDLLQAVASDIRTNGRLADVVNGYLYISNSLVVGSSTSPTPRPVTVIIADGGTATLVSPFNFSVALSKTSLAIYSGSQSAAVTCYVAGGTAPYKYSWACLETSTPRFYATNATGATTTFCCNAPATKHTGHMQCTVTDADGNVKQSSIITIYYHVSST